MTMLTAMSSVNMLSDSQESVLFDPALMDDLQNDLQKDNMYVFDFIWL